MVERANLPLSIQHARNSYRARIGLHLPRHHHSSKLGCWAREWRTQRGNSKRLVSSDLCSRFVRRLLIYLLLYQGRYHLQIFFQKPHDSQHLSSTRRSHRGAGLSGSFSPNPSTHVYSADAFASLLVFQLFISLLTTTLSYSISLYINLSITVFTLFVELFWIGVVWRAFPVLGVEESGRIAARRMRSEELEQREESQGKRTAGERWEAWKEGWRQMKRDWIEFIRLPVFLTSLSIALVYLTTLSFGEWP